MSYLYGIDQQAQAKLSDQLDNTKGAPQQLGAFDNFWASVGGNLAAGGLKVAQLGTYFQDPDQAAAEAMAHGIRGDSPDWQAKDEQARVEARRLLAQKAKEVMPNPLKTGFASNIVGGLAQVLPTAVVGGAIAGPVGAMALVGGSQGVGDYQESLLDGVDPTTAAKKAALTGAVSGVGVAIPMAKVGAGLATNLGIGAGVNIGLGMGQRAGTAAILESGGYHDMAAQYKWLDGEAIAVDTVLGMAFGAIGHYFPHGGKERTDDKPAPKPAPTPEQVDAALALNDRLHVENEAQPGVHRTVESRDAGVQAMEKALDDMVVHDRMPDVAEAAARMDVSPNPAAHEFHQAVQGELDLAMPKVEPPAELAAAPDAFQPVTVKDAEGKPIPGLQVEFDNGAGSTGVLELGVKDDRMYPTWVDNGLAYGVQSTKGKVVALYERAIAEAKRRGLKFTSDNSVATGAVRIYEALARRGYEVTKNPNARLATHPEVVTDRWVTDDGSPVFEVKPKESAPPKPHDNTPEGMAKAGDVQPIEGAMAEQILTGHPDLEIPVGIDAEGNPTMRKFSDVMAEMDRDIAQAQTDSVLHDVAVACFLRG